MDNDTIETGAARWQAIVEQFNKAPDAYIAPISLMNTTANDSGIAAAAMKWFAARGQTMEASKRRHILELTGVQPDTWRYRDAGSQIQQGRRHERAMLRVLALECEKKRLEEVTKPSNTEGDSAESIGAASVSNTGTPLPIKTPINLEVEVS